MDLSLLPAVNALLNAVAASLLVWGRSLARARRIAEHRRVMIAAFAVSSLFLVGYLAHKAAQGFENTTFHAAGAAKAAYLALLASHVILAMTVPVLALTLIALGLGGRRERHRRLARIAWPVWIYVSVTGVLIYVLLYHLNPAPPGASRGAPSAAPAFGPIGQPMAARPRPVRDPGRVDVIPSRGEVEKASGVGYLPKVRRAPPRAFPPGAPSWVPR